MKARRGDRAAVTRAFASLVALLGVVLAVPAVLVAIGAVPHGLPSVHQVLISLASRDDTGDSFRAAAGVAVWVAWVIFTVATVKEAVGCIRFRGPRASAPLHGMRRLGPAGLVTAVALLFVAAPIEPALPPAHAEIAVASPTSNGIASAAVNSLPHPTIRSTPDSDTTSMELPTYRVQRYDTLWSIAERYLPGDPAQRYKDIRNLNQGSVGQDNEIVADTVLTLPADSHGLPGALATTTATERMVTVQIGDTLSGLADLNGMHDWRDAWERNEGRAEPNGAQFTDPDHIEPGWTIGLPASARQQAPAAPHQTPTSTPTRPIPRAPVPGSPDPTRPSSAGSGPQAAPNVSAPAARHPSSVEQPQTGRSAQHSAVGAYQELFAGGGLLLAAGLSTMLVAHRRRQHRFRRSGRTIATAPSMSVPAERALIAAQPAALANTQFLDSALRSLAAVIAADPAGVMPNILATRLDDQQLVLHLCAPHSAEPPAPWQSDEARLRWSLGFDALLPHTAEADPTALAPYPALVTVGHEPGGGTWLLDLETAGLLAVTGDSERCLDFGRFLAAELAVNAWSNQVATTIVGLGDDVADLNPDRLHPAQLDEAVRAAAHELRRGLTAQDDLETDLLTRRLGRTPGEPWMPAVLLAATQTGSTATSSEQLNPLLSNLDPRSDRRSPVAVVLLGVDAAETRQGLTATLTLNGRLLIPELGLDVIAQQLPAEQIRPIAQLLAQAAELRDHPMPPSTGEAGYEQFCDAAGALRDELTLPRENSEVADDQGGHRPRREADETLSAAAKSTLLPLADEAYLERAATTTGDLDTLAPRVAPELREKLGDADPGLDEDLVAWFDPGCPLARLSLLGPVELRAHGERSADVQRRVAYYTELAAYLATRDHGATAEQVAAAFNVAVSTAYSRLAVLKGWLGTDPRTADRYLPDASKSPEGRARGVGLYQLRGVLLDADLFKRLRLRGQMRGPEGIPDLNTALALVSGPPFDQLRSGGYEWLTDGNRFDHIYVDAIVDVAHIVATHGLAAGDLGTARAAAEIALLAAPYEEKPRLDLVAIRHAEGRCDEAEAYLRSEICNRSDDGEAPLDLPARTEEILRRRRWLARAR